MCLIIIVGEFALSNEPPPKQLPSPNLSVEVGVLGDGGGVPSERASGDVAEAAVLLILPVSTITITYELSVIF